MAQINPRLISDAVQLADGVFELILTDWGNRGQKRDKNNASIIYPPVASTPTGIPPGVSIGESGTALAQPIPSAVALAISPRSDVDRCIVRTSGLPQMPGSLAQLATFSPGTPGFVERGGVLATEHVLAVGAPIVAPLLGPIAIRAHPSTWFADQLFDAGSPTSRPFGSELAIVGGLGAPFGSDGGQVWISPTLRVLVYTTTRTPLVPPRERSPLSVAFAWHFSTPTEELVRVVPIAGRKYVRVAVRAIAGAGSVRLTGAFYFAETSANPPEFANLRANYGVELVAATPIAANGAVLLTVPTRPGVPFLLISATANIGNIFDFAVEATD
jgi:hypothetical protein